jgi:hypothetical protein
MYLAKFIAFFLIFGCFCEQPNIITALSQSPIITVIANVTNINITSFQLNVAIAVNTNINRVQVLSSDIYNDTYTNITFIFTQRTNIEILNNEKTSIALTVAFQLYFVNRYNQQYYNDLFGSFMINSIMVGSFFPEIPTQIPTQTSITTSKPKPIATSNITNLNVTNIDQPIQNDNTLYIIIVCCVIGGIACVLLGIFLVKKYIAKGKYKSSAKITYGL